MIEKATKTDIQEIVKLAKITREHMIESGINQWTGDYPNKLHFLSDLENKGLFVYKQDNLIVATVSLLPENDQAYKEISWKKNNSLVIHRVIVNPAYQNLGIGKELFSLAYRIGKLNGYESIKVDTHPENNKMQGLIISQGYNYRGYLTSINRLAYERVI
ncbi:MAG: GNAT family N-acetyltransferase [Sphaerochaetaceae bacterium]|nr:GNAT family N-acetyltransferase [Sphaerochaetaceae bacterium]